MYQNIRKHEVIYSPAAVGADGVKKILQVKKGDRLIAAHAMAQIPAAASTDTIAVLGLETDDPNGFIEAIDLEANAAGVLIDGKGDLLDFGGGHLFLADDTIDVSYSGTTYGATLPRLKFFLYILEAGL